MIPDGPIDRTEYAVEYRHADGTVFTRSPSASVAQAEEWAERARRDRAAASVAVVTRQVFVTEWAEVS